MSGPEMAPAARVRAAPAYAAATASTGPGAALRLNANECPTLTAELVADARLSLDGIARYPDAGPLRRKLAARLGVGADRVVVTAGADDALARICTALVEPGRNVVVTAPTFEMIPIYASLAGGEVRQTPWLEGPFPTEAVIGRVDAGTAAVFVVSPNNPTGLIASGADLKRIREACPGPALVLDAAYEEFADRPLTPTALTLPNTVATRTFSKAFGLAGLRVGYAVGDGAIVGLMSRAGVGQPYAVSGPSLELVERWLDPLSGRVEGTVRRVVAERAVLHDDARSLGLDALASQGNFVLVRFASPAQADAVAAALAGRGIPVRSFSSRPEISDRLRITCPAEESRFQTLRSALRAAVTETLEP